MSRKGAVQWKSKRDNRDVVADNQTKTDETKLYLKTDSKTGTVRANFMPWYRSWLNEKMGKYPKKFNSELIAGESEVWNKEEMLAQYVDEVELPTTKDHFIPTDEESVELEGLPVGMARDRREKEFFIAWSAANKQQNVRIKMDNEQRKTKRAQIEKDDADREDIINELITDICADMSPQSLKKIEAYVEDHDDDEAMTDFSRAKVINDWMWFFRAARETHQVRAADIDPFTRLKRVEQEKKILEGMKHTGGRFEDWQRRFDDQLECVQELEDVGDIYIMSHYVTCLNNVVFERTKELWSDSITRVGYPDNYVALRSKIQNVFAEVSQNDPQRIVRAFSQKHEEPREAAFNINQKGGRGRGAGGGNGGRGAGAGGGGRGGGSGGGHGGSDDKWTCWICEEEDHRAADCPHNNKKYTIEQNAAYVKKMKKEKNAAKKGKGDDEKKEEPERREKAKRCDLSVIDPESNLPVLLTREEELTIDLELDTKEFVKSAGVRSGEIDFVLDTAAEPGITSDSGLAALRNIKKQRVIIEGIAGEVVSTEYGENVFGKSRILSQSNGCNLVSQFEAGKRFQCINPDPDMFVLRGWPKGHRCYRPELEGQEWIFHRDHERYGDQQLHCTMPIKRFKVYNNAINKFYQPDEVVEANSLSPEELEVIKKADSVHYRMNHLQAPGLIRTIKATSDPMLDISVKEVELWKRVKGDHCTGCLEGGMIEHDRVKSTKPPEQEAVGESAEADIMFVEVRDGRPKVPLYLQVDKKSKCLFAAKMAGRKIVDLQKSFAAVLAQIELAGRKLKKLTFDRESAIVPLEAWIEQQGVELNLKAAGQKAALIEVNIRYVRRSARATKAGVRAKRGYAPPPQFNVDLVFDTLGVLNRAPKDGMTESPASMFTGRAIDYMRDFRVEWGELIIVKKPKGISSDLKVTGEWSAVVKRMMNGTGVMKVYLVSTGKYAYRIKFARAEPPSWVLEKLNSMSHDSTIGFEDEPGEVEADEANGDVTAALENIKLNEEAAKVAPGDESFELLEDQEVDIERDVALDDAIGLLEHTEELEFVDPMEDTALLPSVTNVVTRSQVADRGEELETERAAERYADDVVMGWREPELDDVGRVTFGAGNRRTDLNLARARGVLKKAYLERVATDVMGETQVEEVHIYYEQAKKTRPDEAEAALRKEVSTAIHKKIWHGVKASDLTAEQSALILPMMKNYVEKYLPDGDFEKSKVRVLMRGDLQTEIGETEGPVARVESLFMLIGVACFLDLEIFKVDMTAAYMNTELPDSVKHKWVRLDRDVSAILVGSNPGYWKEYVEPRGTILVQMDRLMYGYKEAAHYWWVTLISVFVAAGYRANVKDPCVMMKTEGKLVAFVAITVDDCFFTTTKDTGWIEAQVKLLRDAFEELTVSRGDKQSIIGMSVDMRRNEREAIVSQKNYAMKLGETWGVSRRVPHPTIGELYEENDDEPLREDQREFMSLNSGCMYGGKRTYPEVLPETTHLATRYNKATESDFKKALRVAEYIAGGADTHCLVLKPQSMRLVACADASYGEHADGKSHTGGCIGFLDAAEGVHSWCIFVSSKQPVVAKSSAEAELISASTVGDMLVWAVDFMEDLGYKQGKVCFQQDNQTTMLNLQRGTGSFKRSKHIKVRYFWMKALIDDGSLEVIYVPSEELVADLLTKPLTGARFHYLRGKLLCWGSLVVHL